MKKTALILPGAGARGRSQAGMLKAVSDSGLKLNMIFGTSSGALNGALFTAGQIETMCHLWMTIKNSEVYKWAPLGLLGADKHVFDTKPLESLLSELVNIDQIKANNVPYFVSATDEDSGNPQTFHINSMTRSDGLRALLASASLPILFPSVSLWKRDFVDGGMGRNMPLTEAYQCGAKRLIVLQPTAAGTGVKPRGLISMIGDVIEMFQNGIYEVEYEAIRNIQKIDKDVELIIVRPSAPPPNGLLEFQLGAPAARAIIDDGYNLARAALVSAGLWRSNVT